MIREKVKSWWGRFNNAYSAYKANEESPKQQKIISKLADSYTNYQLTTLGLGNIPFASKEQEQQKLTLLDTFEALGNFSSAKGSVVPSPMMDEYFRYYHLGLSPDLLDRRIVYDEYDKVFSTCSTVEEAADELIRGAFLHGTEIKIAPAKGYEQDPRTIDNAGEIDLLWQNDLSPILNPDWFCLLGRSTLRYGNAPFEFDVTDQGRILDLVQLSPYAMQINSDINLKFYPGQEDCFEQFDDAGKHWLARWPEALVFWLATKQLAWHRYGSSRLFAALAEARALVRGEATLPDNREEGKLQKFAIYRDIAGNPISNDQIDEAKYYEDQARRPGETKVYNGAVEIGMLQPSSDNYTKTEDLVHFGSGIAARFGTQYAKMRVAQQMNRATLTYMDEMVNVNQAQFRNQIALTTLNEVKKRLIIWQNALAESRKSFYRIDTVTNVIDPKKLQVKIIAQNNAPSDVLELQANGAIAGYQIGLIDWESAVEAQALRQGKDPEQVKQNLIKEGKAPAYILEAQAQKNQLVTGSKQLQSLVKPKAKTNLRVVNQ